MNIDKKNLEKINERMKGWTVAEVSSGTGENLFVITLEKDKNTRTITLCGNDLGGWIK